MISQGRQTFVRKQTEKAVERRSCENTVALQDTEKKANRSYSPEQPACRPSMPDDCGECLFRQEVVSSAKPAVSLDIRTQPETMPEHIPTPKEQKPAKLRNAETTEKKTAIKPALPEPEKIEKAPKALEMPGLESCKASDTGLQTSEPHDKNATQKARIKEEKARRSASQPIKTAKYIPNQSTEMIEQTAAAPPSKVLAMAERRKAVEAVRASNRTVKDAAQNAVSGLRNAINAARELAGSIMAGGGVVIVIVLVIFLAGLLIASPFGLFFSGEDHGTGYSMPEAVAQLNGEFTAQLEQIQAEIPHDTLDLDSTAASAMISNWNNVLAVYAVYVAADETDPHDVAMLTEETFSVLRDIFWKMNEISYFTESIPHTEIIQNEDGEPEEVTTTETILHITVTVKDYQQMADEYGFNAEQKELLEELLRPEYQELFQALTGSSQSLTLTPQEVQEIMERLPDDLSEERRQVVLTAYQLLGKVNYFWGGKSLVLGWDSRWGTPQKVWASGNSSTGTVRPFGLDCSGFVDWVFYNISDGEYVIGHGGGAAAQHSYCSDISWSEAIPGDLVFYPGDSHVGIVCGFDEGGNVLIIHCASSANNVAVTGKSGFVTVGRPNYYS